MTAAKKTAAKKAVEVKPSNIRTIQVSSPPSNKAVEEEGYLIVDDYGDGPVWHSVDGPYKTEADAIKASKRERETPYFIVKFQIVARCI